MHRRLPRLARYRPLLLLLLAWPALDAARAATHAVSVRDNAYDPSALTVAPGDTVVWTKTGTNDHTVTWDDGTGESTLAAPYSRRFDTAGTYRYHCRFHPGTMTGAVTVQAATTTSSTTTSSSTTTTTIRRSVVVSTTTTTAAPAGGDTTTTTTTTTTAVPPTALPDEATTTTAAESVREAAQGPGDRDDEESGVDLPAGVAAVLLLLTSGAALWQARRGTP